MKLTSKLLIRLSLIIDKMGIANEIANIDKSTNEEVGKALISIIFSKLHLAEKELYEWISEVKSITVEEAQNVDLIELIKEFKDSDIYEKLKPFLPSAQD